MSELVVRLPEAVASALGVGGRQLEAEVIRRIVASLYAQDRIGLGQALDLTAMTPGEFAGLLVSLRLSVGGSEAEKRRDVWSTLQEWGKIARETGLTLDEIDEEVRAVRDARGH